MAEVFEDKLMNLQERIVSTCLEALEGIDASVDTTYIYGYWTKSTVFFNVFFTVGNSVIGYGKLGVADDLVLQVFNHGKDDVREMTIFAMLQRAAYNKMNKDMTDYDKRMDIILSELKDDFREQAI